MRRGFQCPGYPLRLRWSSKHQRSQAQINSPALSGVGNDTYASEIYRGSLQEGGIVCLSSSKGEKPHIWRFSLQRPVSCLSSTDTTTSAHATRYGSTPSFEFIEEQLEPAFPSSLDLFDTTSQDLLDQCFNPDTAGSNVDHIDLLTPWTFSQHPVDISQGSAIPLPHCIQDKANSPGQRPSMTTTQDVTISQSPIDISTTLIEYWFTHVCPIWSTFDSESNYNRQIASTSWTNSGAVFYTLQSMSAAHLEHNMPHLRPILPSLTSNAVECIKEAVIQTKAAQPPKVDSRLVFAMFGIGTSAHWTDPSVDRTWLDDTRGILQLWGSNLAPSESFTHAYLNQAQVYWEMLMCAAAVDFTHGKLDRRRQRYKKELQDAMQLGKADDSPLSQQIGPPQAFEGTRPNSWCGVSSEVIDVLGQVFSLCRAARERQKVGSSFSIVTTCDTLCDIKVAYELQSELAAMDFDGAMFVDELLGFPTHTGDVATPTLHLMQTAEAYRFASLLQLYLTFDDLEIAPLGDAATSSRSSNWCLQDDSWRSTSRAQRLVALALRIVAILEGIPAESGSRSIHPILYLSAASGLKFDQDLGREREGHRNVRQASAQSVAEADCTGSEPTSASLPVTDNRYSAPTLHSTHTATHTAVRSESVAKNHRQHQNLHTIQRSSLEVAKARQFVQARMGSLRHTLPPRPLEIVSDLIRSIWTAYDSASFELPSDSWDNGADIHWLDIMTKSNLRTLFG